MSKIRLMYSSNATWVASGYGVQGRSLLPRLAELPEVGGRQNVAQFAWYGLQGGCHSVDGFQVYPAGNDPYGNDVLDSHMKDFGANVLISLIDVWVMKQTAQKIAPGLWCPWLPIDHDPVPEPFLSALEGAHLPLTYSKWGQQMLRDAGIANHYIPHGIEPSIFRVDPNVDSVKAFKRNVLRCEGHLTVIVAANKGYPDRKWLQGQFRAWAEFSKDKPDAKLYVHTEPTPTYGGLDLVKLAINCGIADKIAFPDRYQYYKGLPAEFLAMVYNAADALMSNSMAEGFGIPIIEAQACGAPVVVTDFSAMPELVRWGVKVAPADMIWTPMNAWQAWPSKDGIVEALESLHATWHDQGDAWTMQQRLRTSAAIHKEFSWDIIVRDQWAPLMAKLANEAPPLKQDEVVAKQPKSKKRGKVAKLETVVPEEIAE